MVYLIGYNEYGVACFWATYVDWRQFCNHAGSGVLWATMLECGVRTYEVKE